MAIKISKTVRNAMLNAIESTIGTGAVLKIHAGAAPAGIESTDSGTVLVTMQLDADWMAAASSGVKVFTGTWSDTSADATGTAGHFRLYAVDGTTQHMQGTVTGSTGGGDMTLDNTSISTGQTVTVTGFTLTGGNA